MLLQLGAIFGAVGRGLAPFLGTTQLGTTLAAVGTAIQTTALNVGRQYVEGQIGAEIDRLNRNNRTDSAKAALRAAANAVTPTAAPGQTAVFSGGPATGTAFQEPTLLPPSTQPPNRVLQINPGLTSMGAGSFQATRRPPPFFQVPGGPVSTSQIPSAQPVFMGSIARGAIKLGQRIRKGATAFDPRTPIGRRMLGVGAGAAAVEIGAVLGTKALLERAFAPGGDPLRLGGEGAPLPRTAQVPTGLPSVGRFQRDATGCQVQWFFWDGSMDTQPQPIDRQEATCLKRDCIFRLDVFRGKFVKLKSRRMNPANITAFFRSGRRVDAMERICRKVFAEARKQKTGRVKRKRRSKK